MSGLDVNLSVKREYSRGNNLTTGSKGLSVQLWEISKGVFDPKGICSIFFVIVFVFLFF